MVSPMACAGEALYCLFVYALIIVAVGGRSANAQRHDGVIVIKGHFRVNQTVMGAFNFPPKLACYDPVVVHLHLTFFRGANEIVIMKEEGYFL